MRGRGRESQWTLCVGSRRTKEREGAKMKIRKSGRLRQLAHSS